jgi:hypothetical protein
MCEGFPPEHPFFSLATQMHMRYQAVDHRSRWRDDMLGRSAGATQCCFQIHKHFRREY